MATGLALRLFRVCYHYDIYEKMARWTPRLPPVASFLRGKIDPIFLTRNPLFIHVPKNAGTSIATAIYGRAGAHTTAQFYRTAARELFTQTEVFAVLRDPVERFLSAYWFVRNGGGEEVPIHSSFSTVLGRIDSVDQLLDFLEKNSADIYCWDYVLRPQWWFVSDNNGEIIVNKLFILDQGQPELPAYLRQFGIGTVPFKNRTHKGDTQLSERQAARVRSIYHRDVKLIERVLSGAGSRTEATAPPRSNPLSAKSRPRS